MNTRYLRISSAYPLGMSRHEALSQQTQFYQKDDYVLAQQRFALDLGQNIPSFNVGSCPMERKPRCTLSAKLKINLDNVCLTMHSIKLEKRKDCSRSENSDCSSVYEKPYCSKNGMEPIQEADFVLNGISPSRSHKPTRKKRYKSAKLPKGKRRNTIYKKSKLKGNKNGCIVEEAPNKNVKHPGNELKLQQTPKLKQIKENVSIQSKTLPCISKKANSLSPKTSRSFSDFNVILSPNGSFKSSLEGNPATRLTKVYLSEKRSTILMGAPAVPPATPCSGFYDEIEWVPSMSDVKSKRLVSSKLAGLALKQNKKENEERLTREHKLLQEEKQKSKEMLLKIRQRQRAEIYALNKILTEVETATYEKFKEERGLPV